MSKRRRYQQGRRDLNHLAAWLTSGLAFAGRNGPFMLLGGMLIGLIAPPLADAAKPVMPEAVFLFTLGAFLKVDWPAFKAEFERPVFLLLGLVWTLFGVPVATYAMTWTAVADPALLDGMMLCMLAPPVGSAAAIAAMLGLGAPLALLLTVVATMLCPFYLPPLAGMLMSGHLVIDPWAISVRLGAIVGAAGLTAALLRWFASGFINRNPHAMTGIAVAGLILVAIGAMQGMRDTILAAPQQVAAYFAVAMAANAGFQLLGSSLFLPFGRRAFTLGLVSGNRNITLIWAAAAGNLMDEPEVELYLAMSVLPIFILPALSRPLFSRLSRPKIATATMVSPT